MTPALRTAIARAEHKATAPSPGRVILDTFAAYEARIRRGCALAGSYRIYVAGETEPVTFVVKLVWLVSREDPERRHHVRTVLYGVWRGRRLPLLVERAGSTEETQ